MVAPTLAGHPMMPLYQSPAPPVYAPVPIPGPTPQMVMDEVRAMQQQNSLMQGNLLQGQTQLQQQVTQMLANRHQTSAQQATDALDEAVARNAGE